MPMPDPNRTEPVTIDENGLPVQEKNMVSRLVSMILIGIMLGLSDTVFILLAVVQFIIMVLNGGRPNPRLAEFGTALALWIAKAIRYQTAASQTRPWPWTDLD
ncbi:MAG TPA: DUF4389 domain-containing protein [Paracoccaceae bacterium]|nr:DUF4389 domain-containing protein [Paracoccaceae bacterium]